MGEWFVEFGFVFPGGIPNAALQCAQEAEKAGWDEFPQDLIREMKAYIDENRPEQTPYDIVVEGKTPGDQPDRAADVVRPLAEAGATWWIEAHRETQEGVDPRESILMRIRQGPPGI